MNKEEVLDKVNVIYERISNGDGVNENILFSDGNYTEALEVLIDYYEFGFIEELEKIKAEINEEDFDCHYEEDYVYSSGLQKAIEIINNHIAELKGE